MTLDAAARAVTTQAARGARVGRRYARALIRRLLGPGESSAGGYIPAAETVREAERQGLSVEAYIEQLWGSTGATAALVERIRTTGAFGPAETVVEIGPGTGRYLERVRDLARPRRHVIYETAADWRAWLVKTYGVEAPASNGETLAGVDSADLVHAHGVFVYTPFLVTASYLAEIRRVRPRWIVLDVITIDEMADVWPWLAAIDRYPVVTDRTWLLEQLPEHELVDEWRQAYGHGDSRYFVLRSR